jgi:Ca2+-binding RTX toxin-like protein
MIGGIGADVLYGEAGDDLLLIGQEGNDYIDGGAGNDVLYGGADDDHLLGGWGNDVLYGEAGNDLLLGQSGADYIEAGAGSDTIYGGDDNDHVLGGLGADLIFGEAGHDLIIGGDGNDALVGGLGGDNLYGGAGADYFIFNAVIESASTAADLIADFESGDRVDLTAIDAITSTAGNDPFVYIGAAAFSGTAGELRVRSGEQWIVEADVNGDAVADFQLYVSTLNAYQLTIGDFLL